MKKNKKKSVLNIAKSFLLFLVIASFALLITTPAIAQEAEDTLLTTLGQVNKEAGLPGFDSSGHANASYEQGASNITVAVYYAIDLTKYIAATIAIVIIIISGITFVTAGKQIEERASQQKENIKYALFGLIIIFMADVMVKEVFFGEEGEVFRSEADAQMAAERGSEQIQGLYSVMAYFLGSIAVLMIVVAGFSMVASAGNEERTQKSKKQIMYAVAGLLLVGVAEFVVKEIIFPDQGERLSDTAGFRNIIVQFTNFVSGFVATIAVAMFMYGGFLYVTATGKEEQTGKAKKVFIGALIGLILALGAFAIVNTFIELDSSPGSLGGSSAPANLPTNAP